MERVHRGNTLHAHLAVDLRAKRPGVIADLLDVYGREIQGVAYLILRNHADAEEVVMDTLVSAWRKADTIRDDAALRSWLLTTASRHALSHRRRRRPSQPLATALSVAASDADAPSADRIAVADALDSLPKQTRAAVALHHVAGLTVAETAAALGKSENTIKTQLREGLVRLRASLDTSATAIQGDQADVRRA